MSGRVGRWVRLRYMPHDQNEIEVLDADTGEHLGPAAQSDQASSSKLPSCAGPELPMAGVCAPIRARRRRAVGKKRARRAKS
jgi:hypothetical protein